MVRKNIQDIIKIKNTPDKRRKRRYSPRTTSTNPELRTIGVCEFMAQLFELNEKNKRDKKMTDEEICRQVNEYYPHTKTAIALKAGQLTVQHYRSMYNRGSLSPHRPIPLIESRRYDQFGRATFKPLISERRAKARTPSVKPKPIEPYKPPTSPANG